MFTNAVDSYSEALQKLSDRFTRETGKERFTIKELGVWAIRNRHWEPPQDLLLRMCCDDFSRALREEHFTDQAGLPVRTNHVARVKRGEEQLHLWADMRVATHEHMETSFAQRRKHIVGECRQLKRDNNFYQALYPDRPQIQILFDFRDDVEEGQFAGEYPPRKPR
jgi:hypothetical protein